MSRDDSQSPDSGTPCPADEPETMLCPSCMAEATPDADFCEACGAPIGKFSTLDPIKAIFSGGWAYRRAISGRTSPIIFWGMILIFGPATVCYARIVVSGGGRPDLIRFFSAVLFLVLYGTILYRVAKGYLRYRRAKPGRCYECGYALIGLPEARCPECGTPFHPDDLELDESETGSTHGQWDDSAVEAGASQIRATSPVDLLYASTVTFCLVGAAVSGWVCATSTVYQATDFALSAFWVAGLLSNALLANGARGIFGVGACPPSRLRWWTFVANGVLVLIWWFLLGVI